ncbi:PAS domain S-box protein [Thermodesulfobacteriota bacterium]
MARKASEMNRQKNARKKGHRRKVLQKSEDHYQRLFEKSNDAIILHRKGRIIEANPRACQMLGHTEEQLTSMEIPDLHPEEGRKDSAKRLKASWKRESTCFETRFMAADGTLIEVEISSRMIDKDSGLVQGHIRDITLRKKAEIALRESEEKYKQLLNHAPAGIYEIDFELQAFVSVNEVMCQYTGYSEQELLAMNPFELLTPESKEVFSERVRRLASGKKPSSNVAYRIKRKDGTEFWAQLNTRFVFENGKPKRATIVSHNITRRRETEIALRESEERYRNILDSMSDVFYRTDLEGNLLMTNPAGLSLLGYDRMEDVMGRNIAHDFYKNPTQRKSVMAKLMNQGKVRNTEVTLKKKGGDMVFVETSSHLVYDKNGKPVAIEGTVRDRTERKIAEEALQKAHEMLEQRVEERTAALMEANTALKVLLRKRDEDREEWQEKVFINIRQLIEPYITKLRGKTIDEQQKNILDILESNLGDIVSSFSTTLSSKHLSLTPTEIQVANLIKHGKSTKETADLLNSSRRTIEAHRANIRKKLGIRRQKANLRTYLLSLQ